MTRKQCGIIFTLMALIVCVGVLSARLNKDGLTDPTDLASVLSQQGDKDVEDVMSTQEFFYGKRLEKEQNDQQFIEEMKSLSENPETTEDQKQKASDAIMNKTELKAQEGQVELDVRNKGYEDVLCMINDSNVKVYVKVSEELTIEEAASIKKTVEDITSMNEVSIDTLK